MSCYSPLTAYRGPVQENGKRAISWTRTGDAFEAMPYHPPCGKCIGCLKDHAQMWAVRCVHESQMHKQNCMVTLTYDEKFLPKNASLDYHDVKKFFWTLYRNFANKIRYFGAGEYGDKGRPHYHILLFGHHFDDQKLYYERDKLQTFTSDQLTRFWGKGHATVQPVNYGTASYVARYCLKKTGKSIQKYGLEPEKAFMSRNPGIGATWYDKYKSDLYNTDQAISGTFKCKVPRYYDKKLETENPKWFKDIKTGRYIRSMKINDDDARRAVKEYIAIDRASNLKRNYEEQ